MGYTFARVSALVTLRVEDYFQQGRRSWLRLHEKGGKRHEVPCHHSLDEYLDASIVAAKLGVDKKGRLFRSFKKGNKLTTNPLTRTDVLYMIKRRARGAGFPYSTCCHTFRATRITANFKTAAHWSTHSKSPHISHRAPQNCMIGAGMRFRWMKSNESNSNVTD